MNKEITKQDVIELFTKVCPEVYISEAEIKSIQENAFETGTSYETVRDFIIHKAFVEAVAQLYEHYRGKI